jgi:hypothetical protein
MSDKVPTDRGLQSAPPPDAPEAPPPLLGSWRNLYLVVVASLVVWVTLGWWLTRVYGA